MENHKQILNYYELVNKCQTLQELAKAIEYIAKDNNGFINGRTRTFNAEKMIKACLNIERLPLNALTRNYGIRQQAIYILFYADKL